jgi:hypothetical protein
MHRMKSAFWRVETENKFALEKSFRTSRTESEKSDDVTVDVQSSFLSWCRFFDVKNRILETWNARIDEHPKECVTKFQPEAKISPITMLLRRTF